MIDPIVTVDDAFSRDAKIGERSEDAVQPVVLPAGRNRTGWIPFLTPEKTDFWHLPKSMDATAGEPELTWTARYRDLR